MYLGGPSGTATRGSNAEAPARRAHGVAVSGMILFPHGP